MVIDNNISHHDLFCKHFWRFDGDFFAKRMTNRHFFRVQRQKALEVLAEEKKKLTQAEKDVKVLEKHKERMLEIYKEEEKAAELKRLSEVAVQRFLARHREEQEELEREARRNKDK